MIEVVSLTRETIDALEPTYQAFQLCAKEQYRWEMDPIPFANFKQGLVQKFLSGYSVFDTAEPDPVAFMIFRKEDHRAYEINVLYIREGVSEKSVTDKLMSRFIADIREQPGWDVVSFALLGKQETLVRTLPWYGFRAVGQAIVKFDLLDPIGMQIMSQYLPPLLPAGYEIDAWRPQYAGDIAATIYDTFSQAADARWDPRFRSELGARKALSFITSGQMGEHHKQCTSILLKEQIPVGFCFLIQADFAKGNIPLIGIRAAEQGKGFSKMLLKRTLMQAIQEMLASRVAITEISATLDTDNVSAIKMYRRMGFKEEYNYPHAYLTHDKAQQVTIGQWCS